MITVALVGYAMLSGRIGARHEVTVDLGCFILSGAAMIAAGIQAFASGGEAQAPPAPASPPPA